ncbi:MAG: PIN domain-containing protein [Bacteroidales bacterium]|nr:PIN domain-containing protein [Bacteroidales bacterium]
MTKLLIDTNIILDLLARRAPFYESASKLFSQADKKKIHLSVSALSIANTAYVLSRSLDAVRTREILGRFKLLVEIIPLNDKIIGLALNDSDFHDFEDGIQYYSAIEANQDIIITRDLKGFKNSLLPVMSAEEYFASIGK